MTPNKPTKKAIRALANSAFLWNSLPGCRIGKKNMSPTALSTLLTIFKHHQCSVNSPYHMWTLPKALRSAQVAGTGSWFAFVSFKVPVNSLQKHVVPKSTPQRRFSLGKRNRSPRLCFVDRAGITSYMHSRGAYSTRQLRQWSVRVLFWGFIAEVTKTIKSKS